MEGSPEHRVLRKRHHPDSQEPTVDPDPSSTSDKSNPNDYGGTGEGDVVETNLGTSWFPRPESSTLYVGKS